MTLTDALGAVVIGLVAGVLSGLFGVGGGIVMTPGLSILLSEAPIVAVATPLPVIFPTAIVGAWTYQRAGEVDIRAAALICCAGVPAAIGGAALSDVVDGRILLLITAALLTWQSLQILRGKDLPAAREALQMPASTLLLVGLAAGLMSGLLGVGGGLVIVPVLTGVLGMPLKRTLGTSLVAIVALVVPGTIVHALLGHLDWEAALGLAVGALPGARVGAKMALGARERTLRIAVGSFLAIVAIGYGAQQIAELARGR